MEKVRFGIIGCGQIVMSAHLPNLNTIEDAQVVAVCGVTDEEVDRVKHLSKDTDIAGYTNVDELLSNSDVDAVIIAVPNNLHAEIALKSLDAGKAVFLEKPLATTLSDAEKIVEKVREKRGVLQVGYEFHYAELFQRAIAMIQDGMLGDVKILSIQEIRFPLKPGWRNEFSQSGGIMLEKNSHYLQLFNEIAGIEPNYVLGIADRAVNFNTELPDNCVVIINYPQGIKASLVMSLMDPFHERCEMEIIGTKGRMTIDVKRSQISYFLFSSNISATVSVQPVPGKQDAMHPGTRQEILSFITSVRQKTQPDIDAVEAARVTAVALAIEESFTTSRTVEVPHIEKLG